MKTLKNIILIGFSLLLVRGVKAQQNRSLPDFKKLSAGNAIHLELIAADRNALYVESGDPELLTSEVNDGHLTISTKEKNGKNVRIKLYFRELSDIHLGGAAQGTCKDTLRNSPLHIELDGASELSLLTSTQTIQTGQSGASHLTIKGGAQEAIYEASGAAHLDAAGLETHKATVRTSGASKVEIMVTDELTAVAGGASNIYFTGDPPVHNTTVSGMAGVSNKTSGTHFGSMNEDCCDGDTMKIELGRHKLLLIDDKMDNNEKERNRKKRHRMKSVYGGFETGINSFVSPQMDFSMGPNYKFLDTKIGSSWFFGLNLPEIDGHLIRNKLAITTGFGIQWNNLYFKGNNFLTPKVDSLQSTNPGPGISLSENKLYTFDLNAPLLLKFAPGSGKRHARGGFHIAVGAILHYIVTSRVVTETSSNGYLQRVELNDDFNINPFRIDGSVRAGYGRLKFFASYALTPYFDKSTAPDVRLFAAGLTVVGF